MRLQIFVEDELSEAYEVLALRALGLPIAPRNRQAVRAARIDVEDLTTRAGLLDLTRRAMRSGYDKILFILDEEGPSASGRPQTLSSFRQAFLELCTYLVSGQEKALKNAKVARIVCKRCLEGWLLAGPQAIVDEVLRGHGTDYAPAPQRTETLLPAQALEQIAHVIREAGRRIGRRDLSQISSKVIKARGPSFARHVDPARARRYNSSLAYFYDMIDGHQSGCEHPCPE